ncbi:MAG: EAL domain-containing protein [Methylococcaceae bacterium]
MSDSYKRKASIAKTIHLKHLINNSPDGALIIDYDGDVVFANPAAEKLFGRYGDTLTGKPFGFPVVDSDRTELDILHADGTMSVAEMRVSEAQWDGKVSFIITLRDITERKQREEQLRLFKRAVNCSNNGIVITDAMQNDNPVIYVNHAFERITGYSEEEVVGRNTRFLQGSEQNQPEVEQLNTAMREHREANVVFRNYRKDGGLFWNGLYIAPVLDEEDNITHYVGIQNDLTKLKESEQRGRLASQVFENTTEGILITDLEARIIDINPAFTLVTGYEREEVIGQNPSILSSSWQDHDFYKIMWNTIYSTGLWQGEIWNKRKNSEIYAEWLSICVVKDEQGHAVNYVGQFSDITSRKKMEEGLHHLAYYDDLTRLPNRSMLHENLRLAIAKSQRYGGKLALMFIDLDRFKIVNDSLGHHIGDLLLSTVAQRLKDCLREGDFIARLGGDEFTVVIDNFSQKQEIITTAQKIVDTLSVSFQLDEQKVFISCSIGISVFPTDADTLATLLISADSTMYRAKELGGNNYQFCTGDSILPAKERFNLENDLRHALAQDELVVYYQPVVNLYTGAILGAEALLRWQHPKQGLLAPDRFISLAEETGMIVPIGEWVLHTVSAQFLEWSKVHGHCPAIAVNLSVRQLINRNAMESLVTIIEQASQAFISLHLEVTESILLDHSKSTFALLESLKSKGVQLLLDDFGTGYSSLTYLQHFPFDGLKIDRSFISNLESSPNDAAIVKAIIAMANSLGLRVVAEGVETEYQRRFLIEQLCVEAQGYYFSPPVCAVEMTELLRQGIITRPSI